ncbi:MULTISPECIES: PepSY-associated TM helix domain-containing protein [unclassified Nocardioides]|uniref:PepSY-associated TM helix domain-containing protein n=1 Tax=unclassified Nocardioides TaxID=2615069 RepID=UPI00361C9E73
MTDVVAPRRDPADPPGRPPSQARSTGAGWFRAVWRWHFFASFLVAPVLLLLAVTGLIYLFRFELEPLLHPDLMQVDRPAGAVAQPYVQQLAVVESAYPDSTAVSLAEPRQAGDPTIISIETAAGESRDVYVSPYGPEVLGSLNPDTTLSGTAIRLHADLMTGSKWGGYLIELAACWALVMAVTGYYLFVRGWRARRRARTTGRPGARLRWRHGLVGAVAGVGLLMLLVSGLPWTDFWGAKVQELATRQGTSMWSTDHGAISNPTSTLDESLPHSHLQDVPWAQQESEVPSSDPRGRGRNVANVDTAIEVADGAGLRHPMTVALPPADDETGVYSVIGYAFDAPSDERTVHVDRYGGDVVSTYGFDDYPLLAQVVSHGIGLHEGRSLGLWSFWGSALMCAAIVFMCVSGPLMWWRRRPRGSGSLGAPRGRLPVRATPVLAALLVVLAVVLPLFGLSLLLVLVLDQLVLRRVPALARWFGTT